MDKPATGICTQLWDPAPPAHFQAVCSPNPKAWIVWGPPEPSTMISGVWGSYTSPDRATKGRRPSLATLSLHPPWEGKLASDLLPQKHKGKLEEGRTRGRDKGREKPREQRPYGGPVPHLLSELPDRRTHREGCTHVGQPGDQAHGEKGSQV